MKLTKSDFFEAAINKILEIGNTNLIYQDILNIKDWYIGNTWNIKQEKKFKKWFIKHYSKLYNMPKHKGNYSAKKYWEWFNMQYGLKRNDY